MPAHVYCESSLPTEASRGPLAIPKLFQQESTFILAGNLGEVKLGIEI